MNTTLQNPLGRLQTKLWYLSRIATLWGALLVGVPSAVSAAASFRTDINPALLYHQAFLMMADYDQERREYLFTTDWRTQPIDERAAELLAGYDHSFTFLKRAAHSRVPCDWGLDLVDGPHALLPWLSRAKALSRVATFRAQLALQEHRPADARDDLLAAFVMGRNLSRDTVLISALVQIAIENIVTSFVAANYYRFDTVTLEQLVAGFDAAPSRGTIMQCIPTERHGFAGWLIRQIESSMAEHPGEPEITLNLIRTIGKPLFSSEDSDEGFVDKLIEAGGGTPEGVIQYARQLDPLYDELTDLLREPWVTYAARLEEFSDKVETHPNILVAQFFPALEKCRGKEFNIIVSETMLHAALAYRMHGKSGLEKVMDPCGEGPFSFRRFTLEGEDRGFELKSKLNWRGFDEVLIFVEQAGPAFLVDGPSAGKPVSDL